MVVNEVKLDENISIMICRDDEQSERIDFTIVNLNSKDIIIAKKISYDTAYNLMNVLINEINYKKPKSVKNETS